jgi:hypothetical protein
MAEQPVPVGDQEASPAAPSADLACAFGTSWQAHFDGTGGPACAQATLDYRASFAASRAAGDHYASGHTPLEWAASMPLFPVDPDELCWDNGEASFEDNEP